MAKKHKDLEFMVEDSRGKTWYYKTFDEAAGMAVAIAASTGTTTTIDVLTYSRAAAKAYAGDYGVEVYDEDPDASSHDRIEVNADALGRIA